MTLMNEIVLDSPKTKGFAAILNAIEAPAKTLFVLGKEEGNENVELSARNIPTVSMMSSDGINVYDLLNANKVVFTEAAVKEIEEALA